MGPCKHLYFSVSLMRCVSFITIVIATLLGVCTQDSVQAQDFSSQQIDFFENRIRPLLVEHCLACHGAEKDEVRGGLYLTSRSAILKGGDSGPAAVPGQAAESLLIRSVHYEDYEMPPSGQLTSRQIKDLETWVELGLPDPRADDANRGPEKPIDIQLGKRFWAFQALPEEHVDPVTDNDDWSDTPVDQFIHQQYVAAGIRPVGDTDRRTLIRRAYFALIGLPPTNSQAAKFIEDPAGMEEAFAKVVDELLASPHFGERWGRHWLDVARFAESSGGGRSLMFPDAWRFRDYVIDAYNKDKSFDQFILEQIAGDLLPWESHEQKIEQLIGSGFLALGPTNYEQQDKELLRMEVIDEQVDTIGRAFMGLTLGCARCHDHKFDPIPMTDYYALAGIFGSTDSLVDGNVSKYVEQPLATEVEVQLRDDFRKRVAGLTKQRKAAEAKRLSLGGGKERAKSPKSVSSKTLSGVVVDDRHAELSGQWKTSAFTAAFVDGRYLHDMDAGKGEKRAVFTPRLSHGGQYEVRMAYSTGGNRASNVPVMIDHQDGRETVIVNQSQKPPIEGLFVSLGTYRFEADNQSSVTISTAGTDGHVIIDAIQFLSADDKLAKKTGGRKLERESLAGGAQSDLESPEAPALAKLRQQIAELDRQLTTLKQNSPGPLAVAMSVRDSKTPEDGHLYIRGAVRHPGPIVPRGFVSVCCDTESTPDLGKHESGRLQLARWLASPDHPLTARVYVNRVWRHLFGQGIVATPDNFGSMGQRPSHPKLLDYLANDFIREGWSTKKLIRKIMLSRIYRLASVENPSTREIDPENRWLARANRRRVDVEVLRDSILFLSGEIDLAAGGRTIRKMAEYDLGYEFQTVRRSVYVPAFRNSMLDVFEVFDFANPNLVTGHRNTSTLPTQALYLMNSPMVIEQARRAGARLLEENSMSRSDRIVWVFQQVLGRGPTAGEMQHTNSHLDSFDDPHAAWSSVYHALFGSLDFRYVN